MKIWKIAFTMLVAFSVISCSSDPKWADPEAHERTVQLNEQYGPLMVGTWNYEHLGEKQHFVEQLIFKADGTFTGTRIWQTRSLVTIDGEEKYTDWEDINELNGDFSGTWSLTWRSINGGAKADCLFLYATFDDSRKEFTAYCDYMPLSYVNNSTLCFKSKYFTDENGWTNYLRGKTDAQVQAIQKRTDYKLSR